MDDELNARDKVQTGRFISFAQTRACNLFHSSHVNEYGYSMPQDVTASQQHSGVTSTTAYDHQYQQREIYVPNTKVSEMTIEEACR